MKKGQYPYVLLVDMSSLEFVFLRLRSYFLRFATVKASLSKGPQGY